MKFCMLVKERSFYKAMYQKTFVHVEKGPFITCFCDGTTVGHPKRGVNIILTLHHIRNNFLSVASILMKIGMVMLRWSG